MLATRILTALVLVAAVLAALFLLPPRGWGAVALAGIVAAAAEWATLAGYRQAGVVPVRRRRAADRRQSSVLAAGGLCRRLAGRRGARRVRPRDRCSGSSLRRRGCACSGSRARRCSVAIVGWLVLIAAWVAVVELQARSPWLALAAMAIVWVADIAAYFAGRAFGRHKLAPSISPGQDLGRRLRRARRRGRLRGGARALRAAGGLRRGDFRARGRWPGSLLALAARRARPSPVTCSSRC